MRDNKYRVQVQRDYKVTFDLSVLYDVDDAAESLVTSIGEHLDDDVDVLSVLSDNIDIDRFRLNRAARFIEGKGQGIIVSILTLDLNNVSDITGE